jgi:hypothetical protein
MQSQTLEGVYGRALESRRRTQVYRLFLLELEREMLRAISLISKLSSRYNGLLERAIIGGLKACFRELLVECLTSLRGLQKMFDSA